MTKASQPFGRRASETLDGGTDQTAKTTSGTPSWPVPLLTIVPAYLLQLVPGLNIVLIFALSPLWIGLLFNAVLVTMVLDVRRRAAPRALLLVPLTVYGLNLLACGASYLHYRATDQELTRANASQSLPFDPALMSLVAPGELAQDLVQRYAVPVTYSDKPCYDTGMSCSFRVLSRATCDTIPKSPDWSMHLEPVNLDKAYAENACLLQLPAAPDRPPLRVVRSDIKGGIFKGERQRIVLTSPDGRQAVLARGQARILSPVPFPIVTCVTWTNGLECSAMMFGVTRQVGNAGHQGQDQDAPWIAPALGLKPRAHSPVQTEGRRPAVLLDEAEIQQLAIGSEPHVAQAQAFADKAVTEQLARFLRLVTGEAMNDPGLSTWIVVTHADRLDGQAQALMAAIKRDLGDRRAYDRRRQFGQVATALTPQAFARIGPGLLTVIRQDEQLQAADGLIIRLGDLGVQSAPTLVGLFDDTQKTWRTQQAILGLCRAGSEARSFAEQVAVAAQADPTPDRLQAGVIALLRMGRRDLAQRLAAVPINDWANDAGRRRHQKWVDNAMATVGPNSPRASCVVGREEPLPDVPWLKG